MLQFSKDKTKKIKMTQVHHLKVSKNKGKDLEIRIKKREDKFKSQNRL